MRHPLPPRPHRTAHRPPDETYEGEVAQAWYWHCATHEDAAALYSDLSSLESPRPFLLSVGRYGDPDPRDRSERLE